jgi:pre-rRNA-processing protein TSR1
MLIGNQTQPDPFKVILKRIILTGYPIKIKKKQAIVRYMFFNTEDINYYKPCELYTKNGLIGNIKESLGTHGSMKVKFNGFMKLGDVVCMNLYKRVFPKYFY